MFNQLLCGYILVEIVFDIDFIANLTWFTYKQSWDCNPIWFSHACNLWGTLKATPCEFYL